MKIKDGWKIEDKISGLSIEAIGGEYLNHLHIESLDGTMNRDIYFTHEGKCDGTGSCINDVKEEE